MELPYDESMTVSLHSSAAESGRVDDFRELYSLLQCCQVVETAYVKDTIARPQYLEQVNSLMSKVNVVLKALETKGEDVNKFLDEYRVCEIMNYAHQMIFVRRGPVPLVQDKNVAAQSYDLGAKIAQCKTTAEMDLSIEIVLSQLRDLELFISRMSTFHEGHPVLQLMKTCVARMEAIPAHEKLGDREKAQLVADLDKVFSLGGHTFDGAK